MRAGGPVRSCINLVDLLAAQYCVIILTSNRDLGVPPPVQSGPSDRWLNWNSQASVRYCGSKLGRTLHFTAILNRHPNATVYLNSMFSFAGTLWPLVWIWLTRRRNTVVLAPRGMLKPSALRIKRWKKVPLIAGLRLLGVCRRVRFHATSDDEIREIRKAFGDVEVFNVPNVPSMPTQNLSIHQKTVGTANLCFVGRIHPIKNLLWLLERLKRLPGSIRLQVVGPVEDKSYFARCQHVVANLPKSVAVTFHGAKSEVSVKQELSKADAFILPTEGENFGHAIFEAMAAGTPVIISNRTIWKGLRQKNAGWDLDISTPAPFEEAIDELVNMDSATHETLRRSALKLAQDFVDSNRFAEKYELLFSC